MEKYLEFPGTGRTVCRIICSAAAAVLTGYLVYLLIGINIPGSYADIFDYLISDMALDTEMLEGYIPRINFTMFFEVFTWNFRIAICYIPLGLAVTAIYNIIYLIWSIAAGNPYCSRNSFIHFVNVVYAICTYAGIFFVFAASYMFLFFLAADVCTKLPVFITAISVLTAILTAIYIKPFRKKVYRISCEERGMCIENMDTYVKGMLFAAIPALFVAAFFCIIILLVFVFAGGAFRSNEDEHVETHLEERDGQVYEVREVWRG